MKQRLYQYLLCLLCLSGSPAEGYTPANLQTASDSTIETIPLEATVQESPAQISIKSYAAGTFTIYRKSPLGSDWGAAVAAGVVLVSEGVWVDSSVSVGSLYEYRFVNTAGTTYGGIYPTGYILCGIKVDQTLPKGRLAVLVAGDVLASLPGEYAQYKADLTGDGWTVQEVPCPRAANDSGIGNGAIATVKVNAGGASYVTGDSVYLTNASGKKGGAKLTVTGGAITFAPIIAGAGGAGFAVNDVLTISGGSGLGSGASLAVLTIDNSNTGRGVVIASGGAGYRDNDSVTIRGVTSGATSAGSIIATGGVIIGVSAVLPNTFTVGEALTITPASGGSGVGATAGASADSHLLMRSAVQAINNAHPGELQNVVLLGKVPVCRSGLQDYSGADGHGNAAPYGADAFFADMDGVVGTHWTDTGNDFPGNVTANLSGDNQFDQEKISQVGNGKVELGFGRIDLSLGIQSDIEALRSYFNKLHRYKIASADFQPGRRVCDRLSYPNEREADLQAMPGVVGMSNIEFTTTATLPTVRNGQDADQLYSTQHGPYLFYFKGSGGPLAGIGGKAVFWTGMQSHWGYWYEAGLVSSGANGMQKRLAEDSYTLSFTWNIWGLRYIYHRMGMGLDAGDMMKQSINNQGWTTGPYTYKFNNVSNGDYHGSLYMNHMGDPALRLFMFEPPSALSVVKTAGNPMLTWTASPNASVIGYHVYRATNAAGPFTRLTTEPQAGTSYADTGVTAGTYTYLVRAVRLESTGGGTFYNASLGTTQSLNLDTAPSAVSITTATLPGASWNTPISIALSAQGGVPQYAWTLAGGALPAGLTLSNAGVISGTTNVAGSFNISVRATDQIAQAATQALTLTIGSSSSTQLYPEATTYTNKATPTTSFGADEITQISGTTGNMYEAFQRYDLSALAVNNSFTKATLFLYVTSGTATGAYAPVQANLIADAQDSWIDNGIAKPFSGYSNNGGGKVRINCPNHGFATGTQVTIAGLTGTGAPTGPYALTNVDANNFDLPTVTYNSSWAYDPALAYATTVSMTYNTRLTSYNANAGTLTATGTDTAGTQLQMDVTSFVRETLANDPQKKMSLRLFTATPQVVVIGSMNAYAGARPYLVFETTNAPDIAINAPTASPAGIYAGSIILLNTTVTPLLARAGSLTLQWTQVSGPGSTTFTDPISAITGASFTATGDYLLRLTANDGQATSSRDLSVRVLTTPVNGPTDSSLHLRYALDDGSGTIARDTSGVTPANNGALTNAPTWNATGMIGGALTCGTGLQRIEVPDSATNLLDGTPQLSISMWIYLTSLPVGASTYYGVITKRVAPFNKESYRIELRGSTAGTASPVYVTITGGTTLQSSAQLVTNKWYHLVAVFDGSSTTNNLQLYINGSPDKFTTVPPVTVPRNSTAPLRIGANDVNDFVGSMDEVRIYARALTLAEVFDLSQAVPANMGPVVSSSGTISGNVNTALAISATATDDAKPAPLTLAWSLLSGPGSVTFGNSAAAATTATFAQPGTYTLRLTANDGAITTFANAAATITVPPGIATWRFTYFGTTDTTGNRADTANPAGDGLANLLKYALNLNPNTRYTTASAGISYQVPGAGSFMSYTFTGTAGDVTYIVEASSDLNTGIWTPLYTHGSGAPGTVTVHDTQPVSPASPRFMRLRVTNP